MRQYGIGLKKQYENLLALLHWIAPKVSHRFKTKLRW